MTDIKNIAVVQARMGSTRLPGKALRNLAGKPLLQRILERVRQSRAAGGFVLAIPDTSDNDHLYDMGMKCGFGVYRGSEHDVLDRFYKAAGSLKTDPGSTNVIRVCADNPFVDPLEIDRLIGYFSDGAHDYAFNNVPRMGNMYPDGLGAEIVKMSVLESIWRTAAAQEEREHIFQYLWDHPGMFSIGSLKAPEKISCPELKLDVDTESDLARAAGIYGILISRFGEICFSGEQIVQAGIEAKETHGR